MNTAMIVIISRTPVPVLLVVLAVLKIAEEHGNELVFMPLHRIMDVVILIALMIGMMEHGMVRVIKNIATGKLREALFPQVTTFTPVERICAILSLRTIAIPEICSI